MVQQLRKSITTLVFFLAAGTASAQAPQAPLTLRPDAPDRYVVVPGDTLWGISQRYTDSPWRWPELWGMNKEQIRNPHLIYPGAVLYLDRASGRLTMTPPGAAGGPAGAPGTSAGRGEAPSGSMRVAPRVRAEALDKQQIPSIPPSIIEPFLTRPLVVEPDGLDNAPTVVGTEMNRVVIGTGSKAYIRGMGSSGEETWYVYRRGNALVDPDTERLLGYEAIYLGTAQVTRPGEPATVVLTSTVQEINVGDKLVPAGRVLPINYAPHAPDVHVTGRVIGIYAGVGRVGEAGPQQVVSINRGRADGIEVGHVLALYAKGETVFDRSKPRNAPDAQIALPDERSGILFVFRVFERVSYGLIMQITQPVSPRDVVRTP
jgi:nucleoid-associated protein YgaU